MDSNQFKSAADGAIREIIDYHKEIHSRSVKSNVEPGYLKQLLPDCAPEHGEKWEDIQKDIETKIMPGLTHWNSPHFMAFFPAPTSYPSLLGEMYSSAFALSAFNWDCAPAATELEVIVMCWLGKMLNLPSSYTSEEGGGMIQGTTSEAVLNVIVAARERYLFQTTAQLEGLAREHLLSQKRSRLVVLGSDACHSSTAKAAMILGMKYRAVPVSLDDALSMRGESLRVVLDECKKDGLKPFYLTATLGTTSTCAVDDFEEISRVLQAAPVWVHVDAAYAGNALVCEEYHHLTRHLKAFDSFSVSMSKWLLVNPDACCLFVQKQSTLSQALSIDAPYLRSEASSSRQVIDFRNLQIPLSPRFRALKIWFVMRSYGVNGLKSYIRSHIRLGDIFHGLLASRSDLFNIMVPTAFALPVFNIIPPRTPSSKLHQDGRGLDVNALTEDVYNLIKEPGEILLTSTIVGGLYAIRVVAPNPKSEEEHVRKAFAIILSATEEVLRRRSIRDSRDKATPIAPSHYTIFFDRAFG